jgi:hypothetical protein
MELIDEERAAQRPSMAMVRGLEDQSVRVFVWDFGASEPEKRETGGKEAKGKKEAHAAHEERPAIYYQGLCRPEGNHLKGSGMITPSK